MAKISEYEHQQEDEQKYPGKHKKRGAWKDVSHLWQSKNGPSVAAFSIEALGNSRMTTV